MSCQISITINGKPLNTKIELVETVARGALLEDKYIDGLLSTLEQNEITIVDSEDYNFLFDLYCSNDGCEVLPVSINLCDRELTFSWVLEDSIFEVHKKRATIQLTESQWGVFIKSNLDKEISFSDWEIPTDYSFSPTIIPADGGQIFKTYSIVQAFEAVIDNISGGTMTFCIEAGDLLVPNYILMSGFSLRNRGSFRTPVASLRQLLTMMYKLFAYSWYIKDDCFYIAPSESVGTNSNPIIDVDCVDMTLEICDGRNFSGVKVGDPDEMEFNENAGYSFGGTPYNVFTSMNRPDQFGVYQWESECKTGNILDLISDEVKYGNNLIQSVIYNDNDDFDDDLFIIERDGLILAAQAATHLNYTGDVAKIYNPSLTNENIISRWQCALPTQFFGLEDGLYSKGTGLSGVNLGVATIGVPDYEFQMPFTTSLLNWNDNSYIGPRNQETFVDLDIHIRFAPDNLAGTHELFARVFQPDATTLVKEYLVDTQVLAGGVFYSFTVVDSTPYHIPKDYYFAFYYKFTSSGGNIVSADSIDYSAASTFKIKEPQFQVFSSCAPFKYCFTGSTHTSVCDDLPLFGIAKVNGKALRVKKISRNLDSGVTQIEVTSDTCDIFST